MTKVGCASMPDAERNAKCGEAGNREKGQNAQPEQSINTPRYRSHREMSSQLTACKPCWGISIPSGSVDGGRHRRRGCGAGIDSRQVRPEAKLTTH